MKGNLFLPFILGFLLSSVAANAQVTQEDQLRANVGDELKVNTLVSYNFITDTNNDEQPRAYTNTLRLNPFFNYKKFNLSVAASVRYRSVGNEVQASDQDQEFAFQDISLSLSRAVWADHKNVITPYVFAVAPTSQRSQDLGVRGVIGIGSFFNSRFFKNKFIVTNDVSAFGIANTYYFATVDNAAGQRNEVNQSAGAAYNLGLAYVFNRYVNAGVSLRVGTSQFVDGSNVSSFRNLARVNFQYGRGTLFLYYLNGSYPDQTDVELFYYDEYRQLVGAGLNYVF